MRCTLGAGWMSPGANRKKGLEASRALCICCLSVCRYFFPQNPVSLYRGSSSACRFAHATTGAAGFLQGHL